MSPPYEEILSNIPPDLQYILLATALGFFIGLEREWSEKPAGVRTFSLIALIGSLFTLINNQGLILIGAIFILAFSLLLGIKAFLLETVEGLSLTTSVSMLATYGIGILCGLGRIQEAITVTAISSLLLVLKRELHQFSLNLSKEELQGAIEFSVIAFIVYPLLPNENFGPFNSIDPQLVWILVIAVSGLGFVNYILVRQYEEKGFWVTGFFGGLVSSTAVVISISEQSKGNEEIKDIAVSAILLANAAMALRNATLIAFFVPEIVFDIALPIGVISFTGVAIAIYLNATDNTKFDANLQSPFSTKRALTFGGVFLIILIASAMMQAKFGDVGFIPTAFVGGLVSSGSSTTTAVSLFQNGTISPMFAAYGVVAATIASIVVKIGFSTAANSELLKPIFKWNSVLILSGLVSAGIIAIL